MKRITSICLGFFTVFVLFMGTAFAETGYSTKYTGTVNPNAVMLLDAKTGSILYEKNKDEKIRPASTTKILTCLVALENSGPDEEVLVSRNAASEVREGSSYIGLVEGEKVLMKDLLGGMMMVSGNDAAVAAAEHIADSVEDFIGMMNSKAKSIGMDSSEFHSVHGKDTDGHFVTVSDMSKLMLYAFKNKQFMEIVGKSEYTMPKTNKNKEMTLQSTNHLMLSDDSDYYRYATGVKTGSTPEADKCLVATASKDGMDLICLVFGDATEEGSDRWPLAEDLFEFGFDNFATVDMQSFLDMVNPIQAQVENYSESDAGDGLIEFQTPVTTGRYTTIEKDILKNIQDGTDSIETVEEYNVPVPLQAPIMEGDILGTVTYKSKETGAEIYSGNLVASRDIYETGTDPNASGGTAVVTMPPADLNEALTQKDNAGIWWWLLLPGALIIFLVIRLVTVNRRKRKRFKGRKPHYSYRIKR